MVKLAVVGAGIMGSRHARVAGTIPGGGVASVVDQGEHRGRQLAKHVGVAHMALVNALPAAVDAAIVAVPTESHADIGLYCQQVTVHRLQHAEFVGERGRSSPPVYRTARIYEARFPAARVPEARTSVPRTEPAFSVRWRGLT